jgi:acyl-lipid omega-6 desaturase (Delta-12 desaturase)
MEASEATALPMTEQLDRAGYLRLRASLRFTPRFLPTFAILVMDAVLLALAVSLLRGGHIVGFLLAQVLLAIVFFNAFSVLHECGHGSASRFSWLNTLVGHVASVFCFIPYFPWKYIHLKHHTWTGSIDRDPVLRSVQRWRNSGVPWIVRASWWLWIPTGALLQHFVYLAYPLVMWRSGEMTRVKWLRTICSLLWIPVAYCSLWLLVPDLLAPSNWLLAVGLFLVAEELVNIPHHVDMSAFDTKLPIWEQHRATRSCYYPLGVSELLVLNFNFHTEHHLFPSLPWYRLRRARALLKEALSEHYQEAIGIQWNIEHRKHDLQSIVDRYSDKASSLIDAGTTADPIPSRHP